MDKFEIANALMGQLSRGSSAGNAAQTTTWVGIAVEDSDSGVVTVDFGGDTVGDQQPIEIYTTARVKAGDPVIVSAIGASGTGKEMVVAGVIGGGDALATEIQSVAENAEETYLTQLDFQTYYESLNSTIDARIDLKNESYGYALDISEIRQSLGALGTQISDINGMILLGAVLDPETNQPVVGIAIAENVRTDGTITTVDNVDYPTISSGQTFGLYTSKGWQFWVGGRKQGWFDSDDGHLHLKKTTAEESLVIGASTTLWEIVESNGFGIRLMG